MTALGAEPDVYSTVGQIRYLDHLELYRTEKPYEVTFAPVNITQDGVRRTNHSMSFWPITLRDFSANRKDFTTDIHGFELVQFATALSASELQDPSEIESRYHLEAEEYLKNRYNARKVFIFDTTVRKSSLPRQKPQLGN